MDVKKAEENNWVCIARGVECKPPHKIMDCFRCLYENVPFVTMNVNDLLDKFTNFDIKGAVKKAKDYMKGKK